MHFNTYNENYIMINRFERLMNLAHLDSINNRSKDENELFQVFFDMQNSIIAYELKEMKKGNFNVSIIDIAIDMNSKIGNYLLTHQDKPEYITIEQIIHALLICINREEWEYYEELIKIIKRFKEKNCSKIDYASFKLIANEKLTDYIVNSRLYNAKMFKSDKDVYLYEKNKIIKAELPTPTKNKVRRREIINN